MILNNKSDKNNTEINIKYIRINRVKCRGFLIIKYKNHLIQKKFYNLFKKFKISHLAHDP